MDTTELPRKVTLTKQNRQRTHEKMKNYYKIDEHQQSLQERIKRYEQKVADINAKIAELKQFVVIKSDGN